MPLKKATKKQAATPTPPVDNETRDETATVTGSHVGLTLDPQTNEFRAPDTGSLSLAEVVLILCLIAVAVIAVKVF